MPEPSLVNKKTKGPPIPKKKTKMSIMIIAKQNHAGIKSAKTVYKKLQDIADVHLDLSTALRIRKPKGTAVKKFSGDLIITLGGDGTFLWTAYQAQVPILPVRIEGHGFLCTIDYKDFLNKIPQILSGNYKIEKRMRLQCTELNDKILRKIFKKTYPHALNEIAFSRKRPSKVLRLEFKIGDTVFDLVGDGVLFTTPSGSSAYAASAGGPVIDHSLEAISIVPLYPFNSHIRPIIIPADKKVEVVLKSNNCALIIDGHTGEYAKEGTKFYIERGDPVKIAHLGDHQFYEKYKKVFVSHNIL